MKKIINLTFTDYKFKAKLFGVFLLVVLVEVLVFSIPRTMLESSSITTNLLGIALTVPLIAIIFVFIYKLVIEKLVGHYYPNIIVKPLDIIYKGLAILIITYPITILMYILGISLIVTSVLSKSLLIGFILLLIFLFISFQIVILNTSLYYIVLNLIDTKNYGFKCVFTNLMKKLKIMRKQITGIVLTIIAYGIFCLVVISIVVATLTYVNTTFILPVSSAQVTILVSLIQSIILIIVAVIVQITITQYLIIKYEDIKSLIK